MSMPKLPLRFEPQVCHREMAHLQHRELEAHEGFFRENDGSWIIVDSEGERFCSVHFHGKANRGAAWNAPDPEGQAICRLIVEAVNRTVKP